MSAPAVAANSRLVTVYSWPQYTSVSPGKAANFCKDAASARTRPKRRTDMMSGQATRTDGSLNTADAGGVLSICAGVPAKHL